MKCPKCGYENVDDASCLRGLCSELFRPPKPSTSEKVFPSAQDKHQKIPYELIMFIVGLLAYPIIHYLWFLDWVCYYLLILIHELGHSIMYLVFGKITLPKLDFVYESGMSCPVFDSGVAGPIIITGLFILLIYLNRKHTLLLIGSIILSVIYPLLAFTKGQEVLITAAGHLCEAVGAGICFYRCLTTANALSFERPIYAVLGW